MIKKIRILILLYILFMVAVGSWLTKSRTTSWEKTLNVVVYAINGDGSRASEIYINKLKKTNFNGIEAFFKREAKRYNLPLKKPVDIVFAGEMKSLPPMPSSNASILSTMLWSLRLRYWSWKNDDYPYLEDAVVYVLYFDPKKNSVLAHSFGLQKGLIGVVNAFASRTMKKENQIIIAHEILHTVGATDKYDTETNLPIYPNGYAEPNSNPLYPQSKAEIMAGRIPISKNRAEQAEKLTQVVLGKLSAIEINWLQSNEE